MLKSYVDSIDKGESSADLKISQFDADIRESLPNRFTNISTGVTVVLKSDGEDVSVSTSLTGVERNDISSIIETDQFNAIYNDDSEYYYVRTKNGSAYRIETEESRPAIEDPTVEQTATQQIDSSAVGTLRDVLRSVSSTAILSVAEHCRVQHV